MPERTAPDAPRDAREGRGAHGGHLEVTEREWDGVHVVEVIGELDLSTAPGLCLRLEAARHVAHARILVDLSERLEERVTDLLGSMPASLPLEHLVFASWTTWAAPGGRRRSETSFSHRSAIHGQSPKSGPTLA